MFGTVGLIRVKLILRVSVFSGFKLAVVRTNEAVIRGKMFFIVVIFYTDDAVTHEPQQYD